MQIMSLKKDKDDALVRAAALQVIERRHWLVAACFKRVCLSTSLKFYYHHNNYLMIPAQTELDQLTIDTTEACARRDALAQSIIYKE